MGGECRIMPMYKKLRAHFGFLNWWPEDTKFEIMVGAILTQQASWTNVEKAIAIIRRNSALSLKAMAGMSTSRLEAMVRPSGFYRQKARTLKRMCRYVSNNYRSLANFFAKDQAGLRNELLNIKGIGEETADSIILYAAEKPTFVIDAYTKRAMHRICDCDEKIAYDDLKAYFEKNLAVDIELYKDMHAQFVELCKNYCKKKPLCGACPLKRMCDYATSKH